MNWGDRVTGNVVVDDSGNIVERTVSGATVGDETGSIVGGAPTGSLAVRGEVVSITV